MSAIVSGTRSVLRNQFKLTRTGLFKYASMNQACRFSSTNVNEQGGSIIHVTQKTFKDSVLESKVPTIVDFYADWCGPCRMLTPILESSIKFNGNVNLAKVDTEAEHELALQYGITSLPTVIAFVNGEPTESFIGFKNKEFLASFIEKVSGK
ncbi:Thioredoxin, mitochondrial [Smittium culicis]|uniref:Thioredoxin, mitochondrial n=1 Tax=Smittium culicis TaxID=133412 RepID=A0A1R1XVN5_9FUNG|nr:Thioredoxin, mitochondrial [Smittium culicis]